MFDICSFENKQKNCIAFEEMYFEMFLFEYQIPDPLYLLFGFFVCDIRIIQNNNGADLVNFRFESNPYSRY